MASRPPSPLRVRAVEILRQVLRRGAEVPPLLAARETDLSQADRDLLREIVFGVLRHRSQLDSELASVSRAPLGRLAPDLREILEVALYQIRRLDRVPAYAAVDE
ncbi:MAG TPA: transcription antitermination factor NusB, partial [Thermoanaerobaculia bacterium]